MTATVLDRRHQITPRRVEFDYRATPDHWVPGDPHTSHTANVLHLLLPAGERWFCKVYRNALPLVTDEQLRADVKAFIGQEATHSRAHSLVLEHLDARGIDSEPFTKWVDRLFILLKNRSAPGWLPGPVRRRVDGFHLRNQLAVVAAIEHFTAVLGWWILVARGLDDAGADREMVALLRWHGAEEVEHRSVAFDTYQALGGGYLRRSGAMLVTAATMSWLWHLGTGFLLRADPDVTLRRGRLREFNRAARQGKLPPLRAMFLAVPRYLAPRYHPSHEGRTEVAVEYLRSAPGVAVPTP